MMIERKNVLITGASLGLGKETALLFALNNYNIIINYNHSVKEATELSRYIEKTYQVNTLLVKADISKEEEVKNMVDLGIKTFGKIDVLVNNAGIAIDRPFEEKNQSDFRKIIDTNLIGTFLVSKYVSEEMLKKKSGKIINISSTNALNTYYPMSLDYDASKAGIISLTHNFAYQLAPYITVNAVAPGWIDTPMNKNMDQDYKKKEEDKIYLKRFADPKEIANVIFILASDKASYINSSVIRVDGGCIHE